MLITLASGGSRGSSLRRNCTALAARIRAEDGVARVVEIAERYFRID